MALLAIDVGNSRLKWGLHDGSTWIAAAATDHAESASLADIWAQLPAVTRAIGSNVAGRAVRASVDAMLVKLGLTARWIESQSAQCGVRNLYRDPAQLGSDRWAALIAARSLCPETCLVVNAGTAVTVDALSAEGDFLGGLIVPGPNLMREALARHTSQLGREVGGGYTAFPRTTADAIASGAIQAVVGAVERMRSQLQSRGDGAVRVIASGGAIHTLQSHLPPDTVVVDNLVLRGLLAISSA